MATLDNGQVRPYKSREDEIFEQLQATYGGGQSAQPKEETGLGSMVRGLKQGVASGFAGTVGGLANATQAEFGLGGGLANAMDKMAQDNAPTKQYSGWDMVPFVSDFYTNGQGAPRDVGQVLGSYVLPMAVGAGLTAATGTTGGVAAPLLASGLGSLVMAGSEHGNTYKQARDQGLSHEDALKAARTDMAIKAPYYMATEGLQALGGKYILGGFSKNVTDSLIKSAAKKGIAVLGEGAIEGHQEVSENKISEYAMSNDPNKSFFNDVVKGSVDTSTWSPEDWESFRSAFAGTALLGGLGGVAGHAYNKFTGNNEETNQNNNTQGQNETTNYEGEDEAPMQGGSSSIVDRVRALQGQISYYADDGTNCMRTLGIALAGTPYEGQINVDQAIATARELGQLMDPSQYTPRPGDMVVVNGGNHMVMVTENGGVIQNGASHNGVYERPDMSIYDMFGDDIQYIIRTSDFDSYSGGNESYTPSMSEEEIDARLAEIDTEIENAVAGGDQEAFNTLTEERNNLTEEKANILPEDVESLERLKTQVDGEVESVNGEIASAIASQANAKDKGKSFEKLQGLYEKRNKLQARSKQIASKIAMQKVPKTTNTRSQNNAGGFNYGNNFASRMAQAEAIDTGNAQRFQPEDIARGIGRAQGVDYGNNMGGTGSQQQPWQNYRPPQQKEQGQQRPTITPQPGTTSYAERQRQQARDQQWYDMERERAIRNGQLTWGDVQRAIDEGSRIAGENEQVAKGLPMNSTPSRVSPFNTLTRNDAIQHPSRKIAEELRKRNRESAGNSDAVVNFRRKEETGNENSQNKPENQNSKSQQGEENRRREEAAREEQRRQAEIERKAKEAKQKAEEEAKRRKAIKDYVDKANGDLNKFKNFCNMMAGTYALDGLPKEKFKSLIENRASEIKSELKKNAPDGLTNELNYVLGGIDESCKDAIGGYDERVKEVQRNQEEQRRKAEEKRKAEEEAKRKAEEERKQKEEEERKRKEEEARKKAEEEEKRRQEEEAKKPVVHTVNFPDGSKADITMTQKSIEIKYTGAKPSEEVKKRMKAGGFVWKLGKKSWVLESRENFPPLTMDGVKKMLEFAEQVDKKGIETEGEVTHDKGYKLIESSIIYDVLSNQAVSLVGRKVKDAADLAGISQVLRHAGFEKTTWIGVDKKGNIVMQYTASTMLPTQSTIFGGEYNGSGSLWKSQVLKDEILKNNVHALYCLHNHPNGNATPSGMRGSSGDIPAFRAQMRDGGIVAQKLANGGFIVLDHTQYSLITYKDGTTSSERKYVNKPVPEKYRQTYSDSKRVKMSKLPWHWEKDAKQEGIVADEIAKYSADLNKGSKTTLYVMWPWDNKTINAVVELSADFDKRLKDANTFGERLNMLKEISDKYMGSTVVVCTEDQGLYSALKHLAVKNDIGGVIFARDGKAQARQIDSYIYSPDRDFGTPHDHVNRMMGRDTRGIIKPLVSDDSRGKVLNTDKDGNYIGDKAVKASDVSEELTLQQSEEDNAGAKPKIRKELSVSSDYDYGHKEKQFDIISKNNPMNDDYHTGIRSVNDIMSFDQAYERGLEDSDGLFDEYPDWNAKMAKEIMDTPKDKQRVTIYSSKPIQPGVFVTPSRMMAEDYAGGGKIYTKTVPVDRVAWINANEGQFAWVKESDVHYDNLSSAQKQAVDKYLSEGGDNDRLARLLRSPSYRETPWAHQAYNAILWKMAARELMAGREPNFYSALSDNTTKKAHDLMLARGEQGAWDYVLGTVDKFIGHPEKPLNAINASYTNCNPSIDCAKFCYAATGRNYAVNMNKQEMVNFLIEEFPVESARRVFEQYKCTTEFDAQKALRILDKGDISEKWLPFIKEVNKHGVRLQIFSKRAELLSKIDADRNLVMLSIDSSNAGLADKYKDLPLAFVWSGPEDNARLEKERARFERLGGVILPVRIGKKVLDAETIAKIPAWADPYRCPIDAGLKQIGEHNCTQCDKNGGMGCFFGRVTTEVMKKLAEMEDLSNDKVSAMIKEKIDELSELYALKGQNIDERERQQLRKFLDARYAGGVGRNDTRTETGENGRDGRVSQGSRGTTEEERRNSGEVLQRTSREEVTQNPKFKEWFGNSKLVDKDGKPTVLYRGIEEKYDVGKQGEVTWVTPNKEQADSYRNGASGSELLEVYARVERPLYLGDSWTEHSVSSLVKNKLLPALNKAFQNKQLTREQGLKLRSKLNEMIKNDNGEMVPLFELYNDNPDVLSVIKDMGYDAIEVEEGGNRTYGVIGKSNVKSATDNNGNFSRDNDDIHYSVQDNKGNAKIFTSEQQISEVQDAFATKNVERTGENEVTAHLKNGRDVIVRFGETIKFDVVDRERAEKNLGRKLRPGEAPRGYHYAADLEHVIGLAGTGDRFTLNHEAFHVAKFSLSNRENNALNAKFGNEEAQADAYAEWKTNPDNFNGTIFKKIFRKIERFAKELADRFGVRDLTNDEISEYTFRDIASGEVNSRTGMPWGYEAEQKLQQDEKAFSKLLDEYKADPQKANEVYHVMDTPRTLALFGAKDLPIDIKDKTIRKILNRKHDYQIDKGIFKQVPRALLDPIAVFEEEPYLDGRNGRINKKLVVAVELKDLNGNAIVVPFSLDENSIKFNKRPAYELNLMSSVYSLDNRNRENPKQRYEEFINRIQKGQIAYLNKMKLNKLLGAAEHLKVQTAKKLDELHPAIIIHDRQDLVNLWNKDFTKYSVRGDKKIQGMEYTVSEAEELLKEDVNAKLQEIAEDYGIEISMVDAKLHGSRVRQTARTNSDLDLVVEYKGDIREDELFNALNEEPIILDGVQVDINPIIASDTGTLEKYMERSRKYDEQVLGNDVKYSVRQDANDTPEARGARTISQEEDIPLKAKVQDAMKNAYKNWVDKLDPLNKLQTEIEKSMGTKLDFDKNVYKQARMAESTARGRAEMLVMGQDAKATVEAINKTMKHAKLKHDVTLRSVFDLIKDAEMSKKYPDYLAKGFKNWQHAFSTYLAANRQLELQSKDSEYVGPMSNADAKAIVNNAPQELKDAAQAYYKYNDNMLTIAEDAGLISKEVHEALNKKYNSYAPMLRDFSDTAGVDSFFGGLGGRGIGNVSSFLKKISKGSDRNVIDPLETTVKNTYMILDRAERNKVAQIFVDLSHNNGIGEFIEPVDRESSDPKNSIFTVMVDGKKQAFKTMPEYYGAIAGYNEQGAGAIASLVRSAAQCLRTGATISPDFMFRNLVRDTIFAGISSKTGFRPLIDTINGIRALRNNEQLAEEFKAAGVPMSNFVGTNRRGAAQTLDKLTGGDKKYHKLDPRRIINALYEMAQDYSELAEEGTRMGEFMRARAQGKSIEEAGFLAKEITLDFSRSGVYGQKYNQAVPFFNACIQGGDKFVRLMKHEPRATFMGIAKYIILPSIALWCMNHDEDWYKDLPEDVKNGSWCIKTGDTIWRIPKPQEAGVLFGSGMERFLDMLNDENPKAMKEWAREYFFGTCMPNFMPTIALPIIEWQTNYSFFTGKNVVGSRFQKLPDEMQYNLYTTELAKRVGSVTGTSPMKIDNTIKGYFGTAGSFVAQSMDNIFGKEYETPEKRWSEYAGIRGITYQEGRRSQTVSDFYELVDEANKQHEAYGKKGKPAGYVVGLRNANKKISELNKAIRETTTSRSLSPEQKRAKIDKMQLQIRNIAKLALHRFKDKVNS